MKLWRQKTSLNYFSFILAEDGIVNALLMFACTLVSDLTAVIKQPTHILACVQAAGLKPAISPCWLDVFYILYLTACSFNAPHSTKPIYFPSTKWPPKASLTRPQRLAPVNCSQRSTQSCGEVYQGSGGKESKEGKSTNRNLGELPTQEDKAEEGRASHLETGCKATDRKVGL